MKFSGVRSNVSSLVFSLMGFQLALAVLSQQASGEPFVIGFERFARHGELLPEDAGELLINELNCVACHSTDAKWSSRKGAPDLRAAGLRLRAGWLTRYLSDPATVDPGTTMPDVLRDVDPPKKAAVINALVAYLSNQRQPFKTMKAGGATPVIHEFWKHGNARHGKRLYHTIGCVACHQPDPDYEGSGTANSAFEDLLEQLDPEEIEELGLTAMVREVPSIPHGELSRKYTERSLTMMLLDPGVVRPSGRMPNLRLTPDEAADIAAYLLNDEGGSEDGKVAENDFGEPSAELVKEGRQWFHQLGCASCHETNDKHPPVSITPLAKLDFAARNSCVNQPAEGMPGYALNPSQRKAIEQRMAGPAKGELREPARLVKNKLIQLNCVGCHARSGGESKVAWGGVGRFRVPYFETVGQVDLGDEGRLPPPLTGVGAKLTAKALAGVFALKTTPYRDYLTIRMPAYHPSTVTELQEWIEAADRNGRQRDPQELPQTHRQEIKQLIPAGRQLADTGCVQCHRFSGEALPGVVGIDLQGITSRVRPEWFRDFLFNPTELKSRTRMPTFFPDGKSNSPAVLNGDVNRQIAALWFYLDQVGEPSLPGKILQAYAANYELSPTDRAVVLRTFMDGVGTHAIAVGFPAGVHYALDSENCRLAIGWKGRFLDARGTWFERFTPPAKPLGTQVLTLEATQSPWGFGSQENESQSVSVTPVFKGYRLDSGGIPTMLYRLGNFEVQDKIEPGKQGLARKLTVKLPSRVTQKPQDDHSNRLRWFIDAEAKFSTVGQQENAGSNSASKVDEVLSFGSIGWKNADGLLIRASGTGVRLVTPENEDGIGKRWLELNPPCTLKLEYQW